MKRKYVMKPLFIFTKKRRNYKKKYNWKRIVIENKNQEKKTLDFNQSCDIFPQNSLNNNTKEKKIKSV